MHLSILSDLKKTTAVVESLSTTSTRCSVTEITSLLQDSTNRMRNLHQVFPYFWWVWYLVYLAWCFSHVHLTSWLHVFIWWIFLKLMPCCWFLDDFLFLILGYFLYIFSLQMFAIDPDGNPSRLLYLVCCLICINVLLYITTGCLLVDCVYGYLINTCLFSVGIIWIRLENGSLLVILLWGTKGLGYISMFLGHICVSFESF